MNLKREEYNIKNDGDVLLVSFDPAFDRDGAAICVMRVNGDKKEVVKMKLDKEAEDLYRAITDQACNVKIM